MERITSAEELLQLQKNYFHCGATLAVNGRVFYLKKLYETIRARESEICAALKNDLGKSATESFMCEIGIVYGEISYMIKHAKRLAKDKRVHTPLAQFAAKSYIKRSPYGCVLVMSPWNYPFLLSVEPLVDAIAAGNCVILKPSAYSPATSAVLKSLVEAVFPPERAAVVSGGRSENAALLGLPFDKIFFTGSVAVGKEVMRRAAERLVPVTLELGGKSPCIVDGTANVPLAAKRIVFGKFLNCGQTCVAPDYILAHESIRKQLLSELRKQIALQFGEHPLENENYGKIINRKHFDRICDLVDPEKIFTGGQTEPNALRIAPTVLGNVDWNDACMQEEIFGPVLPVLSYRNDEELLNALQALPSPLALYLFTSNKHAIENFTTRLSFGGGCVNDTVIHLSAPNLPFGGVGNSGMGAYHGDAGFACFTHEKSIVNKKTAIDLPMRYQPYKKKNDALIRRFLK